MKYDIQAIKQEAFKRAGVASPTQKEASAEDINSQEIIFELKNFSKLAGADDDLLLIYAGIVKEARERALKRAGWDKGLTLR